MDKQAKIAIEAEMLQVENTIKSDIANHSALIFGNANAKREGRELPNSESTIKWYEARISKMNGRLVELTLKLAAL